MGNLHSETEIRTAMSFLEEAQHTIMLACNYIKGSNDIKLKRMRSEIDDVLSDLDDELYFGDDCEDD